MNKTNILSILSLIVVFISLLFSVFLFTVKTKNKLANILFGLFILLNAVDISAWFLDRYLPGCFNFLMFKAQLSILTNPLFYLYALSVCYSDFRLRAKHLLHGIPWLVANLVLIPRFYGVDETGKLAFLEHYSRMPETVFISIISHLQFFYCIVGVFLVLRRYRRIYRENYADAGSITYPWLFQLTVVITVVHTIVMVKSALKLAGYDATFANVEIITAINAMLVICWFVLKALYHPTLFRRVDSRLQPVADLVTAPPAGQPPAKEGINVETQEKIAQLKKYMEQAEPFLEPSLTVQDLAGQLKMPVRELSVLINHHLGQHFFDFVNEYRVRKAMGILRDPAKQSLTIQEIFYEVGFNSKSSFNTAFKKYTDQTPTQYKKGSL